MPPPSAKIAKEMADSMTIGVLMSSGWYHALAGHYNFDNPANQPDVNKSYFTIPMGGKPKGNDMGLCLADACANSNVRSRTICRGQGSAIMVYRSSNGGVTVGKTKHGVDCTITCVILDKDVKDKVIVKTAYPVTVIPAGPPLV